MTAIPQAQPPTSQSQIGGTAEPGARVNTPEGFVQDVTFDQDGNEDEDGKITEHARNLKRLDDYQEEIQRLQQQRDQLVQHAATHSRAEQTQSAIKQPELHRERLIKEIQQL
jgi:uncharacterized protein YlxW (UPF0749 family)